MTTPTIADYLKYANLQMAAEAFLRKEKIDENGTLITEKYYQDQPLIDALKVGNDHASKFTETAAKDFAAKWKVLDQRANTSTGFSGTLFENLETHELVLSFRSTEFIDDALRDNAATNVLELKNTGFAWGQLTDMEAWYAELNREGGALHNQRFAVTGYSLGGHLANAFNVLRQENFEQYRVNQVVTFNGAGMGIVKKGTIKDALATFNSLRNDPALLKRELKITSPGLSDLYDTIQTKLADKSWTALEARDAVDALYAPTWPGIPLVVIPADAKRIIAALNEVIDLEREVERIKNYKAGGEGAGAKEGPAFVDAASIPAHRLDYRLAVALTAERSEAGNLIGDALRSIGDKNYLSALQSNQWDVVGAETTSSLWSGVANSFWHQGNDVPVFIEDQPFKRGTVVGDALKAWVDYQDPSKLLFNGYDQNDFGDTHSLVLIVDSLNVQNTLLQLVPQGERDATAPKLNDILKAASYLKKEEGDMADGKGQG
jgi:hypothetical protein